MGSGSVSELRRVPLSTPIVTCALAPSGATSESRATNAMTGAVELTWITALPMPTISSGSSNGAEV